MMTESYGTLQMPVAQPSLRQSPGRFAAAIRPVAWADAVARRFPIAGVLICIFFSNILGSVFNIGYNTELIVNRLMDPDQKWVFAKVAFPFYNLVVYPVGFSLTIWIIVPVARCRRSLRLGRATSQRMLEIARKRLVNLPFYQVCLNLLGWLPGAVVFPFLICSLGGNHEWQRIWGQFALSFVVSAFLTTAQTFFLLEWFLKRYYYDDFFRDSRPAATRGAIRLPFGFRLGLLWSALAFPLVALWLVVMNFNVGDFDDEPLEALATNVMVIGGLSGLFVFTLVGYDLWKWVTAHALVTEQVEMGNYDVHIDERRPDEWGQLTDRFNDMVSALGRAKQMRETFGQFISPALRDLVMQHYAGVEDGEIQEVTVMFVDIRGFTRRSQGDSPSGVVSLLNRFLTLGVNNVEEGRGGLVNKFLGDGFMALFGVLDERTDHADTAVAAAVELLRRLGDLNAKLAQEGQAPLEVGIGIHTGLALTGCIGATVTLPDGRESYRREFTAIGETVNLAQRLEQLTKTHGGPILISEQTRAKLTSNWRLHSHGEVAVPGYDGRLTVYQIKD